MHLMKLILSTWELRGSGELHWGCWGRDKQRRAWGRRRNACLDNFLDIFLWTRLNSYVGDEDGGVLGGWVGTDSDLPDALPRSLPLPDLPDHPRRDLAFNNYNRPRRRTHATPPFPRTTAPSGWSWGSASACRGRRRRGWCPRGGRWSRGRGWARGRGGRGRPPRAGATTVRPHLGRSLQRTVYYFEGFGGPVYYRLQLRGLQEEGEGNA